MLSVPIMVSLGNLHWFDQGGNVGVKDMDALTGLLAHI